MSKHTPWKVKPSGYGTWLFELNDKAGKSAKPKELLAIATLMEAAPDLLDVCKATVQKLAYGSYDDMCEDVIDPLNAAIEKAEPKL
jgi:hypothetical protein